MKRIAPPLLVVALLGLGCVSSAPASQADACRWISRASVQAIAGVPITHAEAETLPSGQPSCSYFTGERERVLWTAGDTQAVDQVVTSLVNAYPTEHRPAVARLVGIGQAAALITLGTGSFQVYATTGTQGYLFSNMGDSRISREQLTEIATQAMRSR